MIKNKITCSLQSHSELYHSAKEYPFLVLPRNDSYIGRRNAYLGVEWGGLGLAFEAVVIVA